MANIDNLGNIVINRGECFQAPLFINISGNDNNPIRLDFNKASHLGIEVYFGVYLPQQSFEYSFIQKKFTYDSGNVNKYGDIMISLGSQDTFLVQPGKYYYSVKIRMLDEKDGEYIATVVDRKNFYII